MFETPLLKALSSRDAAYRVLQDAGEPLHYKEITKQVIEQGLWHTTGATPEQTLGRDLREDAKKANSRFVLLGKGMFDLTSSVGPMPGPPPKRLSEEQVAERLLSLFNDPNRDKEALACWFLEVRLGLDEAEAPSYVCSTKDIGIDALYVDDEKKIIYFLQSHQKENVGESDSNDKLELFLSRLRQVFSDPRALREALKHGGQTVTSLVHDQGVLEKLERGDYYVMGIYITSGKFTAKQEEHLETSEDDAVSVSGYDFDDLGVWLSALEHAGPVESEHQFHFRQHFTHPLPNSKVKVIFGLAPAKQLANLPGIEDLTLFELNVRKSLGKTNVNKALAKSLEDLTQHSLFPTFHNGVTIIAGQANRDANQESLYWIDRFSVVNGCQTVTSLHAHKSELTDELLIPVRLVHDEDFHLSDVITERSNNQNKIDAPDLHANDLRQKKLEAAFNSLFGSYVHYKRQRGGDTGAKTKDGTPILKIDNAAQLRSAFFLEKPWLGDKKPKLFGAEYDNVFPETMTPHELFVAYVAFQVTQKMLDPTHEPPLLGSQPGRDAMSRFGLTRLFLLWVTAEILRSYPRTASWSTAPVKTVPPLAEIEAEVERTVSLAAVYLRRYVQGREDGVIPDWDGQKQQGQYPFRDEMKREAAMVKIKAWIFNAIEEDKILKSGPFS
jgi:hypothetical protein